MLLFGAPAGLFLNMLMFLPVVIFMFFLPYTGHGRDDASARAPRLSFRGAIQLMRDASASPTILSMILLGGATSLLVGNAFQAQMPEFAHDYGHDKQDVAYSMLLGANAAGAVVGGILLGGRRVAESESAQCGGLLDSLVSCHHRVCGVDKLLAFRRFALLRRAS